MCHELFHQDDTHTQGTHQYKTQRLGLKPPVQQLLQGTGGEGSGGEGEVAVKSQDVLSGWALGSGPPMPVTHEAGKWRKSGTALSEALLSPF